MHTPMKTSFVCIDCDYTCNVKYNMNLHLSGKKHKQAILANSNTPYVDSIHSKCIICVCGEIFHKNKDLNIHCNEKKCMVKPAPTPTTATTNATQQSIVDLISQNKELIDMMVVQNQKHEEERNRQIESSNKTQTQINELMCVVKDVLPKIGNTTNNAVTI